MSTLEHQTIQKTPYNYCANKVEKIHKEVGYALRALISQKLQWAKLIPLIQLGLNTSISRITQFLPYFLMYGRNPQISREIIHPSFDELTSENQYVKDLAERMQESLKIVQANIDRQLLYREKSYKDNINIEKGDLFLVFMPRKYKGISEKLLPGYSYPFKVIEKLSFCIFKVESLEWNNKKVVLQRSITFLKELKGQQVLANQEVEQKTNFTEKDFALTHEYEETETMEGVADREVGIRHTNSEGVTLVTTLDGTQKAS